MTKEEIRKEYLECLEERIKVAESFADEPMFDSLKAVCNSPYGYCLFYPMSGAFYHYSNEMDKMDFDALCELYGWLSYCWDDDGETSFVCATISSDLKLPVNNKPYIRDEIFVMKGERDNLSWNLVEKYALFHDSNRDSKLLSYKSCLFGKDTLNFLYNLIPKFEEWSKLGSTKFEKDDYKAYRNSEEEIQNILKQHIESSKYMFKGTL